MTPERWVHVKELFHAALEEAERSRGAFLAERCGTDAELMQEVSALLRQHVAAGDGRAAEEPGDGAGEGSVALEGVGPTAGLETQTIGEAAALPEGVQTAVQGFGDYELVEQIARGGMGVVYKARQVSLNRTVALKMILAGQFASEREVKRFQAEAQAVAVLDHRHIVGIYEIGQHKGQHYFTMPYIEGQNLAYLAAQGRWRGGTEAAKLVVKIVRAVQYAHERGILHRDLKPANILMDGDGEPHILDFGLARHIGVDSTLTMEGAVMGTPSFMSPEQAAGKTTQSGITADIYSLGAILYFLLTGRPPFTAASPFDTIVQVLEGEVVVPRLINPRVGRDLERICLRCLEKLPQRRYPDAGSLAEDLEHFLRHEPVKARPPGFKPLLRHWIRHQTALVSRLIGLAICLTTAVVTFHFDPKRPNQGQIEATMGVWALLSVVCQWAGAKERWKGMVPFLWVILDTACLTAVLRFEEATLMAMPGPLLACFPVLVILSGLWFRVPLVGFATLMAMLAYSFLVVDLYVRTGLGRPSWDFVFLLFLAVAGCVVSYMVYRVRALSRFYDRRD